MNFPDMQSMIFSKKTIRTTSIPKKLGTFISAFGSYRSTTLKTVNFGQKLAKILSKMTKIFVISEFSRHIEHDFLKEDH